MLLRTGTPFSNAVLAIFERIDAGIPASVHTRIPAVLVGGAAVHLYTGSRVSKDAEAIIGGRLLIPDEIIVRYEDESGRTNAVRFDRSYNPVIALLHPDAERDAIPFRQLGRFDLRILTPVDLAVTKIGRYEGNDQADIAALAREGLLDPRALKERAEEAIGYYIGDTSRVLTSLGLALETVQDETPPPMPAGGDVA